MQRWKRAQREARPIIGYASISIVLAVVVIVIVASGWQATWFGALCGVVLLLLWRRVRSGIYVNDSGVRVARFLDTKVLPWDQLVAVEVSSGARPQLLLRTTSGEVVHTQVYRAFTGRRNDNWLRPATFDRLVATLRDLHQEKGKIDKNTPGPSDPAR